MSNIQSATQANCKTSFLTLTNQYKLTVEIKTKLLRYQDNCLDYYCYGTPSLNILHSQLIEISKLVSNQLTENWERIVKKATDNYGTPKRFWHSIKSLRGSERTSIPYLLNSYYNDDSESDTFDTQVNNHITNKQQ